jgi:hypothetical protein
MGVYCMSEPFEASNMMFILLVLLFLLTEKEDL